MSGDIPGGQGCIVPVTGGDFELRAHSDLEVSDGAIIQVWNNVVARADPPPQGATTPTRFLRSSTRLEAPKGPYDWLNNGTLNAPADGRAPVTIHRFEVI